MTRKGEKSTPQEAAAGAANLARWKERNPSGGALRHGTHSGYVRAKYASCRYREGRMLRRIVRGLVDDLGGRDNLSNGQSLLIDTSIRPKLITLLCISRWVDSQEELVDKKGELAKCLSTNYLAYTNSLRLDLQALYEMASKKPSRIPDLEGYLKETYSGAKANDQKV